MKQFVLLVNGHNCKEVFHRFIITVRVHLPRGLANWTLDWIDGVGGVKLSLLNRVVAGINHERRKLEIICNKYCVIVETPSSTCSSLNGEMNSVKACLTTFLLNFDPQNVSVFLI